MKWSSFVGAALAAALAFSPAVPAQARDTELEARFDAAFGTQVRAPADYGAVYDNAIARQLMQLADGARGRIGIAAVDLATGQEVAVLGDQPFPMASTSKIAIAATFLEGVDQGRWSMNSQYPLMMPVASRPFSSAVAPVRRGAHMSAAQLIELMITRSSNTATDALLAAVGGPAAVNDWARRAGLNNFNLTRDIATLVRDDGEIDPATRIDVRDSATPRDMVRLLAGIYQGTWLSPASGRVIVSAMERCRTGRDRIPAGLPGGVTIAHKTGTLSNTASDIGILTTPDGRSIAVAIYVTGQGGKPQRAAKIASLTRAIFNGYQEQAARHYANATYPATAQ